MFLRVPGATVAVLKLPMGGKRVWGSRGGVFEGVRGDSQVPLVCTTLSQKATRSPEWLRPTNWTR